MAADRTLGPRPVRLADYRPPAYLIDTIALDIDLDPARTRVTSRLSVRTNPARGDPVPLRLDGESLSLVSIARDGVALSPRDYTIDTEGITFHRPFETAALTIVTETDPGANTALEGLYLSGETLCTQCEAEGFRRITYFIDRPDVLATYRVRLAADSGRFPVLLSNGNRTAAGRLEGGRHWVEWHDPHPKPCYLFALVAGRLARLEGTFETRSGRRIALHLYVEPGNEPRAAYALAALKRAMAWDEATYGLEYDLDVFQIVAVSDFNMGAMENKGLNIFNAKYILADPETATDQDYAAIEAVVAHEYFHNWTGNRITCRDWFQLSLKEGLTVFRDQQFQADMRSAPVKRIADVRALRTQQFPEDEGPLAHPVRPDSYVEINNFYTATVYEKGAEVIRMLHTLLGATAFRRGMDLYVARNDGKAATVEDFVAAMEAASGRDLAQFRRWYSQPGTPRLAATWSHDPRTGELLLTLRQECPALTGYPMPEPLHIPVACGLVGPPSADPAGGATRVLELTRAEEKFRLTGVPDGSVPSLLRGFSAPVRFDHGLSDAARAHLMGHDSDPFNRWDQTQGFASELVVSAARGMPAGPRCALLADALARSISADLEPAFQAQMLTLPSVREITQLAGGVDVEAIHQARESLIAELATRLREPLEEAYGRAQLNEPYAPTAAQAGQRALRNAALRLLAGLKSPDIIARVDRHYRAADNMTDRMAALAILNDLDAPERARALDHFYAAWRTNALVIDKWLMLQATSTLPGTVEAVRALMRHEAFTLRNPNRVRALIGSFVHMNPLRFHRPDGAGYRLLVDAVRALDPLNPQTAARLVTAFESWRRFDPTRQDLMASCLKEISRFSSLSPNLGELVSKMLR